MSPTLSLIAGIAAAVLITAGGIAQALRAVRSDDVDGVSLAGAALIVTSCAGWVWYSILIGSPVLVASSAGGVAIWGFISVVVARRRSERVPTSAVVWGATIGAAYLVGGLDVLGAVLVAEAVVGTVPQAARVWSRDTVAGVSLPTYAMMASAASLWVVYGIGTGDWVLIASQATKAAVCGLVLVKLTSTQPAPAAAASS